MAFPYLICYFTFAYYRTTLHFVFTISQFHTFNYFCQSISFTEMELTVDTIKSWEGEDGSTLRSGQLLALIEAHSDGSFPPLSTDVKQAYASYVCKLFDQLPSTDRKQMLQFLRIVLRDKANSDLDCFIPILAILLKISALSPSEDGENETCVQMDVVLEVEKCLVNLLFNSSKAQQIFKGAPFERLIGRVCAVVNALRGENTAYSGYEYLNGWTGGEVEELLLYDIKITFIMTALVRSLQTECVNDTDKTMCFIKVVNFFAPKLSVSGSQGQENFTGTYAWKYVNETLKILFNFYHSAKMFDLEVAQRCADECALIVRNQQLDMESKQNAVNLLALLSVTLPNLCPKLDEKSSESIGDAMEGYDMGLVSGLLKAFEAQIDIFEKEKTLAEFLCTFLTVLNYLCSEHKAARRFCRMKVIPPLKAKHVEQRPEVGEEFRNKIVRLIMHTSRCNELAAEFMFVLCKRSVGRMIKYCGFGHSAGLLANYGCLGQAMHARHESDSEDSETEEYKQVEEQVNPVTGSITSPEQMEEWQRKLDAMSDEQKEYEMMKLVECMDKLMDQGLIAPGTIGEDGKPRQVKHVAELIKDAKEEENSSDED